MHPWARRLAWCAAGGAWLLGGCAGNNRYLSGSPHALIPEARKIKSAYADVLALPRELDKQPFGPYVVEPGDVLVIQPARQDATVAVPADQPVLPDGRIQLGQYGFHPVAGKSLDQVEAEVNAIVRATTKDAPLLTVRLSSNDSKVYYVVGEVNAPNAYPFRGRETVLDAILRAGGLTSNASRRDILLSRPTPPPSCRVVLPICYNEIVQLADTTTNYHLRPGDRIYVPTRGACESLCPHKGICPPCGRPQTPCPIPSGRVADQECPPAPHPE